MFRFAARCARSLPAGSLTRPLLSILALTLVLPAPAAADRYPSEDEWIEVMFVQDSKVRLRGSTLVDLGATPGLSGVAGVLASVGATEWHRLSHVPEEKLDDLRANGEARTGKSLYDLNNVHRLRIPEGRDVWAVADALEALPGVYLARPVPLPPPLPVPPDYTSNQGYLRPASSTPTGIDTDTSFLYPGGDGTGVTICDLEYSWNYNHADVTKAVGSQINTLVADPFNDTNHGTAVLGELVADQNAYGVTGASHGANVLTCGTYYGATPVWNVPGAMAVAMANLSAGDVILLEQQWDYAGGGTFVPIEFWLDYSPNPQSQNAVYQAIQTATANGIFVVEAGGNGYYDTDTLTWQSQASGAILVGAGGAYAGGGWPAGDLERLAFSNYGSRFHLQGWGEDVYTTGYGTLYSAEGVNQYYTSSFSGTSSASPIVSSAVANCIGYWKWQGRNPMELAGAGLRRILMNTGTPQVNPGTGRIGPRPDLAKAMHAMETPWTEGPLGPIADPGQNGCVVWLDFDGDGDEDLFVGNSDSNPTDSANKLLRNDGDWNFVDVSAGPIPNTGYSIGASTADYDNDGDLDLYVVNNTQTNQLLRNDGGGAFTDVTPASIVGTSTDSDACWGDTDNDGDVDLYLVSSMIQANRLFRNDGGTAFVDVTSGALAGPAAWGAVAEFADADGDNDLDLYVGSFQADAMLRNDGGNSFVDVTAGPVGQVDVTNSVAWGDYDNDGDLDIYVANSAFPNWNNLLRNDGNFSFVDVAGPALADTTFFPKAGYCVEWGDYDNDGFQDLMLSNNGHENRLFLNDLNGGFDDVAYGSMWGEQASARQTAGVAWADYDGDGDLDLYQGSFNANSIFRNDNATNSNWLHIKLVGTASNKAGIGARVRMEIDGRTLTREVSGGGGRGQSSLLVEFGICHWGDIDLVEVRWPSGQVDSLLAPVTKNQVLTWVEGQGPVATSVETMVAAGPAFRLYQNAPNPFRPATTIRFDLPRPAPVTLRVFDVAGRTVRTLVGETMASGPHAVRWDGRNDRGGRASAGVYFYRLESGDLRESRRMVLLK